MPVQSLVDLRRAFIATYGQLRPLLLAAPAPGFLIAAVAPSWQVNSTYLPLTPDESSHAVLGRHSNCALRLHGDPSLSLRHLLASAWVDPETGPTLRLLDLGGEVPLRLEDNSYCVGLQADGTVFAALRGHAIFCIFDDGEAWPQDAEEAWSSLGDRAARSREAQRRDGSFDREVRPQLRLIPSVRPSQEESLTATGTAVIRLTGTAGLQDIRPGDVEAVGFLRLPGDRFVRLTPEDLARGVVIGRYDRCEITDGFSNAKAVSRVHLCLALDPSGLWAIDLASSNGTWVEDRSIGALRLGRRLRLSLGTEDLVWELNAH